MLTGDVDVGRFLSAETQDGLIDRLRVLLAAPFLAFWFVPTLPFALLLAMLTAAGYAASLPLQERMVARTAPDTRGQALGLLSTGLMAGQAVGALLAGTVADLLGVGPGAAGRAMAVMAPRCQGAGGVTAR